MSHTVEILSVGTDLAVLRQVRLLEVVVRHLLPHAVEEAADALIAPVEREVRALLGELVYGADVSGLEQVVLEGARDRGLTLGTAESCTGGLIGRGA